MSQKKEIRKEFRQAVFQRDEYRCRCCGVPGYDRQEEMKVGCIPLDAHHITPRKKMPSGGYVKENGISLCGDDCHLKAEQFWNLGTAVPGFHPDDLYAKIGSSLEKAKAASERL